VVGRPLRPALGPTQPPIILVPGRSGVKETGGVALTPAPAPTHRLKKECSYTCTPLCAFMTCYRINFTFTYRVETIIRYWRLCKFLGVFHLPPYDVERTFSAFFFVCGLKRPDGEWSFFMCAGISAAVCHGGSRTGSLTYHRTEGDDSFAAGVGVGGKKGSAHFVGNSLGLL
jgi:hypothetical protein